MTRLGVEVGTSQRGRPQAGMSRISGMARMARMELAVRPVRAGAGRWRALCAAAALLLVGGPSAAASPVLEMTGMTFVSSRGERAEVVLRSREATVETRSRVAHLVGVRAEVAAAEGREGFSMRCQRGELDLASNDFYAEGDVEGRTETGREFSAPWVRYRHEEGLLFTDAPVTITEDSGFAYKGGGFRYWVRERRFRLLGGASVIREEP